MTQVKNHYVDSLEFPLFTLCPTKITQYGLVPINSSLELDYRFESRDEVEFTDIHLRIHSLYDKVKCYQFNARRDSQGNERELLRFKNVGLILTIKNVPKNSFMSYSITDNSYLPTESELNNFIQPGSYSVIRVEKTIDRKLSEPYNECLHDLAPHESKLVKRILGMNVTYRRETCLEMCRNDIIESIAVAFNVSRYSAVLYYYYDQELAFEFKYDCARLCPLECERVLFTAVENSILLSKDYYDEDLWENLTLIRIVYDKLKYTTVTQTPKTLFVDLISNNGGVLGLFLDISFIGVYRSVIFVVDFLKYLIFKS